MASITKVKSAKGVSWRVQYYSPDGRKRTKRGFAKKADAEAWAAANATSIATGAWIDPTAGRVTVAELADTWWKGRQHLKPSTLERDRERLHKAVLPEWGKRQAASIRPSEVQSWISSLDKAPATVRHYHAILAQILDVAVEDRLLASNPARGVRLPKKPKPRHVYLTPDQVELLADCAGPHAPMVWLLATVGLRWGELAGLKVGDVDLRRGRIHVQRNAVDVRGEVIVGTPKTHEAREVAVSLPTLHRLAPLLQGRGADEWLFPAASGGPMGKQNATTGWFARAVVRAQERQSDFPRVTPHGLRHVAAGLMVSAGANVKVVQRQLGHASAAMTLDTYADLFEEDLGSAADAVGELFSRRVKIESDTGLHAV